MPSTNKTPNIALNQWQGNDYIKRQDFVDDNLAIDLKIKEMDDKVNEFKVPVISVNNKTGSINLVASDVGAIPTTRKVNGKVLSADITLSAIDIKTTDGKTLEEFKTSTNSSLEQIAQQLDNYNSYASVKDVNGIYTVVEYKRADGTLYMKSVLSGGVSPNYTTNTWSFYNNLGTVVVGTKVWTITYDTDGKILSKVAI